VGTGSLLSHGNLNNCDLTPRLRKLTDFARLTHGPYVETRSETTAWYAVLTLRQNGGFSSGAPTYRILKKQKPVPTITMGRRRDHSRVGGLQTKRSQSIFESAEQAATCPRKGLSPPSLTLIA
jgi:hypothetical protein